MRFDRRRFASPKTTRHFGLTPTFVLPLLPSHHGPIQFPTHGDVIAESVSPEGIAFRDGRRLALGTWIAVMTGPKE